MNLLYLKLQNFLSFKELDHTFINGPVLVQGRNLTEIESKESNGSGKSSMEAAIAKCILDTALRKQTLDVNLITWGETEAHLRLGIHCSVRKETLEIHRTLRVKGSASLELSVNDEPVQFATLNDGNAYILNWIGITAEDIKNFYIINKENFKSFVSASNNDKLSLISRFIKAQDLDGVDDLIKERNSPLEAKLHEVETLMNRAQGELSVHERRLEEEEARDLEKEREDRIQSLQAQIDETVNRAEKAQKDIEMAENSITVSNQEIENVNSKIRKVSKHLSELESVDFKSKYDEISKKRANLDKDVEVQRTARELALKSVEACKGEMNRISSILKGTVTCPKCKHEFSTSDPDFDVKTAREELADNANQVEDFELLADKALKNLRSVQEKLKIYDDKTIEVREEERGIIRQIREVNTEITKLKVNVSSLKANISYAEDKISKNEKEISDCEEKCVSLSEQLDKAETEELSNTSDVVKLQIKGVKKNLEKYEKELADLRQRISENVQWGLRFKEFKMSLACEQLKIIQGFANAELQKQKSELRLSIDGFKRDSKGRVKSEITVTVINGEGEYKPFWSYSGGERSRVEVSLIIGFMKMINGTNKWGGLWFLSIDEVLEGTDPLGLSLLLESLKEYDFPIYIISHVMNLHGEVNTLTVVKENGISYLE